MVLLSHLRHCSDSGGLFESHKTFLRSRNSAFDQNKILVRIHSHYFQVLDRNLNAAHVTGHSLALVDSARIRRRSVGTLMTVELGTVAHGSSVLSQSLDSALEAFTFCNCSDIDLVAFCEDVSLDLVAELVICSVFKFKFLNVLLNRCAGLVEVALHCLANAVAVSNFLVALLVNCGDSLFCLTKANLNCLITIVLDSLDLCYDTGACLKDCNRDEFFDSPFVVKNL